MENVRRFFDEFAKENEFDPLSVNNWYSVRLEKLERKKVKTNPPKKKRKKEFSIKK